ncbi:MAG TPA: GFA family protein [Micropepsaceae bacterium]|nr:GFA family protein [Micropepsaceae bacterium]HRK71844.1 GFA family protein [Micropepsaceae bacterium]
MTMPLHGHCLCGAVKFTATPKSMIMDVCHCSMCRRWSGGTFMGVDCGGSVKVEDESALGVYHSSDWGERCFCRNCGTTLFWRMRQGPPHVVVAAQAFDDVSRFSFDLEIFIEEQPPNYAFANKTKRMTGAEFIASVTKK